MIELFEKYYQGELTDVEKKSFESRLSSDQAFASEYQGYLMMVDHLTDRNDVNEALASLKEVHQNYEEKDEGNSVANTNGKTVQLFPRKWLTIAAALLLVCAAVFLLQKPTESVSTSDLYAQYYRAAPIDLTTKSQSDVSDWEQLSLLYNQEDYEKCVELYQAKKGLFSSRPEAVLLFANALMNQSQYQQALEALESLRSDGQMATEKYYYSGLNYMALDDAAAAIESFQRIPSTSNYFAKGEEIVEKLR